MSLTPAALFLPALMALPLTSLAEDFGGHAAHEHGIASLTVAMENQTLLLALESPADNITGFEHAPAKPGEKAAVQSALARLRQPTLLLTNAEAGCRVSGVRADDPFASTGALAHRDFDVEYRLQCRQPGKLSRLDATALFKAFPRLRTLKVDYALPAGQGGATLTPEAATARLVR